MVKKKKQKKEIQIHIRVTPSFNNRLLRIAKATDRPMSRVVRNLLETGLVSYKAD